MVCHVSLTVLLVCTGVVLGERAVDRGKTLVWGPGLKSEVVLPVRYIFIQAVDTHGEK